MTTPIIHAKSYFLLLKTEFKLPLLWFKLIYKCFFCIPVQLCIKISITLLFKWCELFILTTRDYNGIAIYFISIGAWWMICLHSTISHAHKRYHLTIQNWYYSSCSIVILDHIFVEFFWLAGCCYVPSLKRWKRTKKETRGQHSEV